MESGLVPQQIIERSKACARGFVCLEPGSGPHCKVEYVVDREVVFVRCLDVPFCNYQIPFGDGNICSCPVRIALANQSETRK